MDWRSWPGIEVLVSDNERREGTLQHYNLHYNVALVSVKDFCAPHPAKIQHQSHNHYYELVVVGRCFESGVLMAAKGIHRNRQTYLDCKLLQYSTCKTTKAAIGGPTIDFHGNFVGMNFYDLKGVRTPFLLCEVILGVLAYFKTKQTIAEVGRDAYQSGVLDWTIAGDESVRTNRCPGVMLFCCRTVADSPLGLLLATSHHQKMRRVRVLPLWALLVVVVLCAASLVDVTEARRGGGSRGGRRSTYIGGAAGGAAGARGNHSGGARGLSGGTWTACLGSSLLAAAAVLL
ncbi:hypothetical protein PR202_ga09377 [Eleusine coracana subsp. coracana]|uniref:Uncharacterized protein n=1 Tax=Eleusine coracana subsp. coracana TaxID=191504 RepID=A0AAV5C301_ELECO|nr:hypothetical protein PR202_ga09377 [Eleusine coracana subsp. coracana]